MRQSSHGAVVGSSDQVRGNPAAPPKLFLTRYPCTGTLKSEVLTPIPLDKLTLHNDDYTPIGWFDMVTGDPPKGSVALIEINTNAVQQRENAQLLSRIAREREYENRVL